MSKKPNWVESVGSLDDLLSKLSPEDQARVLRMARTTPGRPAREALEELRRAAGSLEGTATIDLASLPPATRAALQIPADLARLSIAGAPARPTPPSGRGSGPGASRHETEAPLSGAREPFGRVIDVDEGTGHATLIVPADAPPPPPRVPSFTRFLSAEGFARWCKRMPLGDDPTLVAHCVEARRRWHRHSVRLQKALSRLRWDFPTFAPRARPYDWAIDR